MLPVLRVESVERLHHACLVAAVGRRDRAECPHDGQAGGREVWGQGRRHGDGEVLRPTEALEVYPGVFVCAAGVSWSAAWEGRMDVLLILIGAMFPHCKTLGSARLTRVVSHTIHLGTHLVHQPAEEDGHVGDITTLEDLVMLHPHLLAHDSQWQHCN